MTKIAEQHSADSLENNVEQYYRFHAPIYDATRWSFLFGRKAIFNMIPNLPPEPEILEIGCGTGYNLRQLENHFPNAHIMGIDISSDMLKVARNKLGHSDCIDLRKANYRSDPLQKQSFDLILLSYSLTMMNDRYEDIISQIAGDLNPDGYVAVVDFHYSSFGWFRRWMNMNHVDFSGRLLPRLQKHFRPIEQEVNIAYGGLWSYFLFIGE